MRLLDTLGSAARPAVVLLDDGQWMDELTIKFLIRWHQELERHAGADRFLVVVVAFRTEEVARDAALRRIRPSVHLKLAPFDHQDVGRLAESMAGPLPSEVVELVCRLSQGSHFMASAVLRGLVESKALLREPEGWRIEPLAIARPIWRVIRPTRRYRLWTRLAIVISCGFARTGPCAFLCTIRFAIRSSID
jgi:two-component system sensor kinase